MVMWEVVRGDCREVLPRLPAEAVVITDPPYNVGYHYHNGGDRRKEREYDDLLLLALRCPSVVVAYPEVAFRYARLAGIVPQRSAAWVYPANTPRQWRIVCWFGLPGYPERVTQPYRNPTDRRIAKLMATGREARGYDWREIPQVKNVSADKTEHPCQNPVEVMRWIIRATDAELIVDPFCGSGTTGVAALMEGRRFIGIETEDRYAAIAENRLAETGQVDLWQAAR
jgi:hypothetical protein